MKASEIVERFDAQPDTDRGGFRASCPVHEGEGRHRPSLLIDFTDDRKALVLCESRGCALDEILVAVGLARRDLFDLSYVGQTLATKRAGVRAPASVDARRSVAGDVYRWAVRLTEELAARPNGEVAGVLREKFGLDTISLSEVERADALGVGMNESGWVTITARTADERVAFVQMRNPDSSQARRWSMVRNPDDRTRWDAAGFVGRRHPEGPALIAEGMSDALTLAALDRWDVVAIRGAANAARVNEVTSELVGRDVVIVVDNDEAGRNMTKRLLETLSPLTSSVSYVRLPEGFDVGDVRAEDPAVFGERVDDLIADAVSFVAEVDFDVDPYLAGTDADRAEALVAWAEVQGLDLAWTSSHGWLVYDGSVWVARCGEARVRQIATGLGKHARGKAGEATAAGNTDRADQLLKFARGFLMTTQVEALLRAAGSLRGVLSSADAFDADPDLLGVGNGVVDLRTGTLRAMKPEDRITRRLAVNYNPDALAPRWEKFLGETLVDETGETADDVVEFVKALVGYGLTGHTSEQFFAILTGTGANGKSVFLNVLGEVFGEIAQRTPFSTFEQKTGGGIPNDLAMLKGSRFVSASESDVNAKMSEATLKAVTGEDTITARFMRAEFFEYRPTFLLMLATNHLPRFLGQDNGLWRRVRLIEWRREFALHEQDPGLAQRIASEEAEGVLALAVQYARAWYDAGRRLPDSPTVAGSSEGYKEDSDVLGPFLKANVERTDNRRDVAFDADLFARYTAWQEALGDRNITGPRLFGSMLNERWGKPPRSAKPKHWRGYRLLAEAEVKQRMHQARREVTGEDPEGIDDVVSLLRVPGDATAKKYEGRFARSGS